jgi:prolipoprotein diacylglyceryltransferase
MEITIHYITDILSILVGIQLYIHSKIEDTVPKHNRVVIIIGALIGALIGSRLIAGLENLELFINPPNFLYYYTNKTIIGGVAGGIIGVEIAKRIIGISVWTGDRVVVPLAIAIIVGRMGCFFSGVQDGTVGEPCNYIWCLEQGDGILRHPNSLYEIIFIFCFLLVYLFIKKQRGSLFLFLQNNPGILFRIFIVLYFSLRFFIEFLKVTHPLLLGINSIQIVCLAVTIWYMHDIFSVLRLAKKTNI